MAKRSPKDPDELRDEIEQTRADLGETVEALAAKADVKTRAKKAVASATDEVKDKAQAAKEQATEAAVAVGDRVRSGAAALREKVDEADVATVVRRPLPLAAIVAGVVAVGV